VKTASSDIPWGSAWCFGRVGSEEEDLRRLTSHFAASHETSNSLGFRAVILQIPFSLSCRCPPV
jgi:hypothetical protein